MAEYSLRVWEWNFSRPLCSDSSRTSTDLHRHTCEGEALTGGQQLGGGAPPVLLRDVQRHELQGFVALDQPAVPLVDSGG